MAYHTIFVYKRKWLKDKIEKSDNKEINDIKNIIL